MAKKKFYQMNKGELEQVAKALHVDVTTDYTKQEIIANIMDAGYDEDDYWKRVGVEEEYHDIPGDVDNVEEPADVEAESVETVAEENDVDEQPDEDEDNDESAATDEEYAYGRFLGRNLTFKVAEGKFSRQRPVFRTTSENLDVLIAKYPAKFRKATETEQKSLG